jgi:hypothetical protein
MKTRNLFLTATLGLATLAGSATAVDVNGEMRRRTANAERLTRISPAIRPKIAAVLSDLEGHGYRPLIDVGVWRSPAEQRAKVRAGYSKTLYSFHTCTAPGGKAASLAADITDHRWFWNSPRPFWLVLAAAADGHDLTTGIYWGLSQAQRQRIHDAIARRDWNAKVALGWDTAHTESPRFRVRRDGSCGPR